MGRLVPEHSATGGSYHGSSGSEFQSLVESGHLSEVLWLIARAPGWSVAELVDDHCLQKPWPMDAGQELIAGLQVA